MFYTASLYRIVINSEILTCLVLVIILQQEFLLDCGFLSFAIEVWVGQRNSGRPFHPSGRPSVLQSVQLVNAIS